MEQHTFKNVNNCLNTSICSYLETSGGQSSNLYLFIFSTLVLIRHLWQLKAAVFLHWCLICNVLLSFGPLSIRPNVIASLKWDWTSNMCDPFSRRGCTFFNFFFFQKCFYLACCTSMQKKGWLDRVLFHKTFTNVIRPIR
jgi:hypothetical protein